MPLKRHRAPSPQVAPTQNVPQRPRASAANVEYERLMAEAKQAFDLLTTQHAMARSKSAARRSSAKTA